ncbi:DEAD-box ATP-dependent RNA helicase 14 [Platanthera zijinensis]|uniref:RNA helicase n=1 Tax=Platanthera zijinensis TaxID=2320716 RepID=A0AAP0B5A2_9ASPA
MTATATASQGSGPRYAPEDPTLPKPWKGLVDGSTGYLYYWNPVTNLTQYQRPVSEEQLPPPPPLPKLAPGSSGTHSHIHGTAHSRNSTRSHAPSDARVSLSAEAYRRQHEITVTGDDVPAPYMTFESTGFLPEMLKEVQHAGFSSPTPIQAQSWPITLQNRDVVAIAKTGSGKTIGYLFPGFVHLKRLRNNSKLGPTVLVLSPTRELATQIQDEAEKFGRSSKISCTCLYGGAPKGPQLRDLDRGVDIVVATPGRLNDILEMRRISLRQVSYLVLDEADRMLDMGFEPQIRKIVNEIPNHRQTLMFTATWPKEVRKIAADLLVNPIQVNIGNIDELVANKAITQYIEMMKPLEKQRRLEQILRSQDAGSKVLIFCSTKRMCDQLARTLARQFVAAAIHGDKSQGDRDRVLNQFKTGRSPILVATDVAARGLDIKDIRVVINYDFPTGVEDYVHRIGRTGRAGATGVSYTFFSDHDSKYARDLVKVLEGADQRVPPELRDMAARGGYGGKSRRWGSGISIRDRGGRIMGRGNSTNGGRIGNDISSNRVDNGNDHNSYGRDRDTRTRYFIFLSLRFLPKANISMTKWNYHYTTRLLSRFITKSLCFLFSFA